jgi:hypothetical protein
VPRHERPVLELRGLLAGQITQAAEAALQLVMDLVAGRDAAENSL